MDRNERINDTVNALQEAQDGFQQKIWTAMPGILQSFDATKMSCVVQPSIQAQLRSPEGKWNNVTMTLCLDCPVVFPGGGGYGMTFPLAEGDEGLLVFASRCIDSWWQSGGVQGQAEFRMHDLSDGFFVPGAFSNPRVPENVSTTTARFWANGQSLLVELDKNGGIATVRAPTKIVLDSPIVQMTGTFSAGNPDAPGVTGTIIGGILATDTIVSNDDVIGGGVSLKTHVHGGVVHGGASTDPPTP